MKPVLIGVLTLCLINDVSLAQRTVGLYKAKVATTDGERLYGSLNDVTDTEVIMGDTEKSPSWFRYCGGRVPFMVIKKVVVKRYNKRSGIIQGAIIGSLLTGFVVVRSA